MEDRKTVYLKAKKEELIKRIKEKGSIIVAFSGGVDSSVVSALAYEALGENALAVTIDTPLLPPTELDYAKKIANYIRINYAIVRLNEFEIPEFRTNPRNRCYLCKKFRFKKLKEIAKREGFKEIAEGTNISDLGQYRPGLQAAKEEGIYHPLVEAALTKEDTRMMAKQMHLTNADKPANTCLASRVPYGQELTVEKLERIAEAEEYIRNETDVKVLRVRDHGNLARLEVGVDERKLFYNEEIMSKIAKKLKQLNYKFVTLDLEGYRFGTFDENK